MGRHGELCPDVLLQVGHGGHTGSSSVAPPPRCEQAGVKLSSSGSGRSSPSVPHACPSCWLPESAGSCLGPCSRESLVTPPPALPDSRHHPEGVLLSPEPRGPPAQKASLDRRLSQKTSAGRAAVSHLAVVEGGASTLGGRGQALLALVWHCPGPSEGHGGQITASLPRPGCGCRPVGPGGRSGPGGRPGRTAGLSRQLGQSLPFAALS